MALRYYRLSIWLILIFEAMNAMELLYIPLREERITWGGEFLYHSAGYLLFEIGLWWFARTKLKLTISPHVFAWLIVAYLHNLPGIIYGWFHTYGWYDQLGHMLMMGTMLMVIAHQITRAILHPYGVRKQWLILGIAFCITMALGVANEIIEYILDLLLGTQTSGGITTDTANDLVMNTIGAGIYLAIAAIRELSSLRAATR